MHCLANLELMPPIGLLRLRLLPVVVVVIVSSWNLIHGFNHIEGNQRRCSALILIDRRCKCLRR